jgi:hypothetical protein
MPDNQGGFLIVWILVHGRYLLILIRFGWGGLIQIADARRLLAPLAGRADDTDACES